MSSDLASALASQEVMPAEVDFPERELTLAGVIIETNPSGITVNVERPAYFETPDTTLRGAWCNLSFVRGRDVYHVPAVVAGTVESVVRLEFQEAPRAADRRDRARYPCSLPVVYRAAHPDGARGAWYAALTQDMSLGGLRLVVKGQVQFPPLVELQISLPAMVDHEEVERIAKMESETPPHLKVTGRARHGCFTPDGTTIVGVRFDHLAAPALLKLGCFLQRLMFASLNAD